MPRSLDPSLMTEVDGFLVADDLFEGLATLGVDGGIVPGVAQSWEVSADGRTWTFHLRPEARWSNGDPVTAADFLYAWRREVDPATGAEYAQALAPITGALEVATGRSPPSALGVEAPDPLTIRLSLVSPTPYLLDLLSRSFMLPLHRATVERFGEDWTRPDHIVSNGPFVLRELVIGDRITLARNPRFRDAGAVHLTSVTYYALVDQQTQVNRFVSGDLDFTSIFPSTQYRWLKSQLGPQVVTGPYLGIVQLAANMLSPPLGKNRDLRRALSMAVDREVIAGKLRQGVQLAAYTLIPPLPGYNPQAPDWAGWDDAHRHAEARRLYAAAGYSAEHPLRLPLVYPTGQDNRDLYDAIAAMWRVNLGAEVEPYNEEMRVFLQDMRLHKAALFQNSWIGDFPDPFTFLQLFQSGFEQNFGANSDPRFDALLAAAANEPDSAQRYRDFERAEARLNEEAPYIPLLYYTSRHLIKPYLKGWQLNIEDRNPSRYLYVLEHEGH